MPPLRMMFPTVTCATICLYDLETIICIPGNHTSNVTHRCIKNENRLTKRLEFGDSVASKV